MIKIDLKLCKKVDKEIISGLCQFYHYDLDANSKLANVHYKKGRYDQMAYFDNYWTEEKRFPYLICHHGLYVGFALVHNTTVSSTADWKIAEFFIMRPYRHQGFGKQAVEWLFKRHDGRWEISVLKDNTSALNFWNTILDKPTTLRQKGYENYIFFEI